VFANFAFPDRTSANYVTGIGVGGKPNTNTVADNSGGNGLITSQWKSPTVESPVSDNTGNLVRTGYVFSGWNTAADGTGTNVAVGAAFPSSVSTTLYAAWTPSNTGLTPNFKTDTTAPIGVIASTGYVINNVYSGITNDLILSDLPDQIQIIASVASGTLAVTTATNLILPTGYQAALTTAAAKISFIGNVADVNAALATLKYTAAATAVSGRPKKCSEGLGKGRLNHVEWSLPGENVQSNSPTARGKNESNYEFIARAWCVASACGGSVARGDHQRRTGTRHPYSY
jgi:uncharacterized repeat protein (TIGR02543 family)